LLKNKLPYDKLKVDKDNVFPYILRVKEILRKRKYLKERK